jgi:hypothetical protein
LQVEPANTELPSANVTLDGDGARHAAINTITDSVNSGFISAAPQHQIGLPQPSLGASHGSASPSLIPAPIPTSALGTLMKAEVAVLR